MTTRHKPTPHTSTRKRHTQRFQPSHKDVPSFLGRRARSGTQERRIAEMFVHEGRHSGEHEHRINTGGCHDSSDSSGAAVHHLLLAARLCLCSVFLRGHTQLCQQRLDTHAVRNHRLHGVLVQCHGRSTVCLRLGITAIHGHVVVVVAITRALGCAVVAITGVARSAIAIRGGAIPGTLRVAAGARVHVLQHMHRVGLVRDHGVAAHVEHLGEVAGLLAGGEPVEQAVAHAGVLRRREQQQDGHREQVRCGGGVGRVEGGTQRHDHGVEQCRAAVGWDLVHHAHELAHQGEARQADGGAVLVKCRDHGLDDLLHHVERV